MQRLDAHLIRGEEAGTALIESLGGGWRIGAKSALDHFGGFPRMLIGEDRSLDFVIYGLTPTEIRPTQGEGPLAAIRYLLDDAEKRRIDPKRISLLGVPPALPSRSGPPSRPTSTWRQP